MDTLKKKNLMGKDGKTIPARTILRNKKYIVYYFSASWCSVCNHLLPKLKKIYNESCKRHAGLEIIYISLDTDQDTMINYYKEQHGNWYLIPFGDDAIDELRLRFGVTHIPYIIVVKTDGTIVSTNAKKEIDELGINVLVTWTD